MSPIDRRRFLHESAAISASLAGLSVTAAAQQEKSETTTKKVSPNEQLRVAVIGVRGRGMDHIRGWSAIPEVHIAAICDVDKNVIGPAQKYITQKQGAEPNYYQDLRKLFEDKDVDAVSIATPNHWHSLAAIWACQAGKDVYVEKPVSHNIREGRKLVEAARKYKRIVQAGTQCRSNKGMQDAIKYLRSGELGAIYLARGLCYRDRPSIGFKPDGPVPDGLDYDLWTGPAEMKPFNPNRLHYNWHWFWNTGNGDIGNQGIHQMDLARWGLNQKGLPKAVQSSGGRLGYKDQAETPNTLITSFEYDDCLLEFAVRGLPTNDELGAKVGVLYFGPKGVLAITSYSHWQAYLGPRLEKGPGGNSGSDQNHFQNFVDGVKARDPKLLNAEIEEGHLSSALCHLGNIAYRLGRKLHVNAEAECFVNDSEANAMLTRPARPPFVVPETV